MSSLPLIVIGAGLAGSECAWQLSALGFSVYLIEMRPGKMTPAHHTDKPAELVCSNSFRAASPENAVGLLKEEMRALNSLIMSSADRNKIPAGGALAVDREAFAGDVEKQIRSSSIRYHAGEVIKIISQEESVKVIFADQSFLSGSRVVIATGPLTSEPLADWIHEATGRDYLYFYDSIAPIVDRDSIDFDIAFWGSRYDKGESEQEKKAYVNCPLTREQYDNFVQMVAMAELVPVHDFDRAQFFEGCLPIEEMVRRGLQTLAYGPLKPVGLRDPRFPEKKFAAVVQLRQDNLHASLLNMVGFQTRMKYGEQMRIFRTIPGLQNAEFVRLGSMHRNTYLCSPALLDEFFALEKYSRVHFAGQITGCEGYVESAAVGLYVALALDAREKGKNWHVPSTETALGALIHHILHADAENFQPMNINFGLFTELTGRIKRAEKKQCYVSRSRLAFEEWRKNV